MSPSPRYLRCPRSTLSTRSARAVHPGRPPTSPHTAGLRQVFLDHIEVSTFPCVGAKAARARDAIEVHEFADLGSPENDRRLWSRLRRFAARMDATDFGGSTLHSIAAVFTGPAGSCEHRFEALLWSQLSRLHRLDREAGQGWAQDVSSDPADPEFSFSIAGHPFFIIGLHPAASRRARRCPRPALVFNSHRQFEWLRRDGRYAKMQAATRRRDRMLQGSINPNLSDFGTASEARQYSGRRVESGWRCPFREEA